MGLYFVTTFLLMSFLLQPTEEKEKTHTSAEPDTSVHFGEFCLRVSDDSHWTSTESVTQLPTQSAPPTKHATQPPGQTTQADMVVMNLVMPINVLPVLRHVGCRCDMMEQKLPNETAQVKSIKMLFPTKRCSSYQIIETLRDGRKVCTTESSLLSIYGYLSGSRPSQPATTYVYEETLVTTPAPLDPTTMLPTTQPTVTEDDSWEFSKYIANCESCNISTNLDDVDPNAVQSLNVTMQAFPCPVHIFVSLKDGGGSCLDTHQLDFKEKLKKLEILHLVEDRTSEKIIDGCRCKEIEQKLPAEASPVTSTIIWPPTETCSSTEFIETLVDGREVCATTLGLSAYFGLGLRSDAQHPVKNSDPNPIPTYQHEDALKHSSMLRERSDSFFVSTVDCFICTPFKNWNSFKPKDVDSLEMDVGSPDCPVLVHVRRKKKKDFCVDSTKPEFRTLLEKLN